jgi:hypothetical protein
MRFRHAAAVTVLSLAPALARADVQLRVIATDPDSPAVLGRWEQFSLRVGYETDRPIRVRGDAFALGQRVTSMTSGAALQAPGTGEALFWFAYTSPARVDRIVIKAEDSRGRTVATREAPVDLTWIGAREGAPRARAEWATRMQDEQNRRLRAQADAAANGPAGWLGLLLAMTVMGGVPGYFIAQALLLWKLRGGWRLAAALPLLPMAAILVYTVVAFRAGSNLFPLVLIFTAPLGFVYLLVLLGVKRVVAH